MVDLARVASSSPSMDRPPGGSSHDEGRGRRRAESVETRWIERKGGGRVLVGLSSTSRAAGPNERALLRPARLRAFPAARRPPQRSIDGRKVGARSVRREHDCWPACPLAVRAYLPMEAACRQ